MRLGFVLSLVLFATPALAKWARIVKDSGAKLD